MAQNASGSECHLVPRVDWFRSPPRPGAPEGVQTERREEKWWEEADDRVAKPIG